MKVLVTGGSGFLGQEIVKKLKVAGHDVTSLSRSQYKKLNELKVPQLQCDLSNRSDVFNNVKKFDAVIHTAAKAGVWGCPSEFMQINFNGTKNLVDACIENSINKFIYTSSPSVAFGSDDLSGVDELTPYPNKYFTDYAQTKAMAEQYVLSKKSNEFKCCALRPHLIWGPNDPHILPRLCDRAKSGKMRIIGQGNNLVDVIFVTNAANAHLLALEKIDSNDSINGSVYFLGQESPVNLWKFINSMLKTQNLKPIEKHISFNAAFKLGALFEGIYKTFRIYKKDPPMTRFVALQMAKSHYFSHEKALKDLGDYLEVTTEEGLSKL